MNIEINLTLQVKASIQLIIHKILWLIWKSQRPVDYIRRRVNASLNLRNTCNSGHLP